MPAFRYLMRAPREPLVRMSLPIAQAGVGEVVIEVEGCGVCHTDLGFLYDGVAPRHPLPLALGHEISGRVIEASPGAEEWIGRAVIVPAVIPCGECSFCRRGHGNVCSKQVMPGNDVHGGFASHVVVPARGLCHVPEGVLASQRKSFLAELSVIADAVSTPYQAILRSELGEGDLAIVIGAGGVGGFAVQLAAASGATVVGIDVDQERLERLRAHGLTLAIDPRGQKEREIRKAILSFASERRLPEAGWRIFECSGTAAGQVTAFGLLTPGAWLGIIGYTRDQVTLRLSNLMAFDARAQGCWGCLPEHYPALLDLVLAGKVQISPFVELHPMEAIADVLAAAHSHQLKARPVLTP